MTNLKPGAVSKYCVNKNKKVTFRQLIHYTLKAQKVIFSIITSNIKNLISKNPGLTKSLIQKYRIVSPPNWLVHDCIMLIFKMSTPSSQLHYENVSAWTTRVVSWIMKICFSMNQQSGQIYMLPRIVSGVFKRKTKKLFTKKVHVWLGSKYGPARSRCWSWICPC